MSFDLTAAFIVQLHKDSHDIKLVDWSCGSLCTYRRKYNIKALSDTPTTHPSIEVAIKASYAHA